MSKHWCAGDVTFDMYEIIIEEEIYYIDDTGYSDNNSDVPSEDGEWNFEP